MQCPKCGGEIPFYDLKPNCKHCGVNIMYYTQDEGLIRDAKRTELEAASARMVIARVKANFIGGKLQIVRMIAVLAAFAVLLIPFADVRFTAPFLQEKLSVEPIRLYLALWNGLLPHARDFLGSTLFADAARAAMIPAVFLCVITVMDLLVFAALLLGFLNLTNSAKFMRGVSLTGVFVAAAAQIVSLVLGAATPSSALSSVTIGFGASAAAAVFLVLFLLNRALLRNGIEPQYRENDVRRKALLRQVRKGEVDLDDLPLPVMESEEEHAERMRALEEALRAEEEGREQ